MKTGPQTDTTKSRLITKLETMQAEQADLIASQMVKFAQHSTDMLNDAVSTIDNDMARFMTETHQIVTQRLLWMRRTFRFGPWTVLLTILIAMTALMAMSVAWNWQVNQMQMTAYGLNKVELNDQIYLILDPQKVRLATCTTASRSLTCLEVMN